MTQKLINLVKIMTRYLSWKENKIVSESGLGSSDIHLNFDRNAITI